MTDPLDWTVTGTVIEWTWIWDFGLDYTNVSQIRSDHDQILINHFLFG